MSRRTILATALCAAALAGCSASAPQYGREKALSLPGRTRQTWAVAPAVNLSGQKGVDGLLQADLLHRQLQQVAGLNVVPVNRVAEVYSALRIDRVQSEEQALLICDLLDCDALVMAAITAWDPYEPPKVGAALNVFFRGGYRRPPDVDPRELARRAAPATLPARPPHRSLVQVAGMFDASNGSTRSEALRYLEGRGDPASPYGQRIIFVEMDRYCGFVYHSLIADLLGRPAVALAAR